ncbi:MarR family winged helix-turn-helix transcriptional regulator [Tahibacter harae]|uniref:MarR family transcriptional regulator n=1 Tax=Tahibacter harae TaxID=2963937 RepID=A0ABT1QPW1_9GAMM|nr:MarR family transcriptional regulator [Tahibacter harae]MCQ4164319.1 MarR family transcriptional regulator [Tahibacter harae]
MDSVAALTAEIARLYPALYLRLHARWGKDEKRPSPEALAVLRHLQRSGPLSMSEAARHFDRAPSAVSELMDRIEANGWIARSVDGRDRRRILIWLTDAGLALLARASEVLSREALARALAQLDATQREQLLLGLRALLQASETLSPGAETPE